MKSRRYGLAVVLIFVVITLIAYTIFNNVDVMAGNFAQQPPPTPAPTRTPGSPVRITPKPIPTLTQTLDTETQVLVKALEIDSGAARWEKPWSLDTSRLEPGRITVAWHPDRSFEGSYYPPEFFETGPVWTVTIQGNVSLDLPGGFGSNANTRYDSITYIIAQKTGNFLGWRTGPPIIHQASATPSTLMSQPPVISTATTLTGSSCTQNPSGLSFRVTQQPGKNTLPGAAGPMHTFSVEGTGFTPGEKVTIVIKGRVTAAGTIGSTDETVGKDSNFATTIAAAVSQPSTPFDVFVIHKRGVACVNLVAVQ